MMTDEVKTYRERLARMGGLAVDVLVGLLDSQDERVCLQAALAIWRALGLDKPPAEPQPEGAYDVVRVVEVAVTRGRGG